MKSYFPFLAVFFLIFALAIKRKLSFKFPVPERIFIEPTGIDDNPNIYVRYPDKVVILADDKFKQDLTKKFGRGKLVATILTTRNKLEVAIKYGGRDHILHLERTTEATDLLTFLKDHDPPSDTIGAIRSFAKTALETYSDGLTALTMAPAFIHDIRSVGYKIAGLSA